VYQSYFQLAQEPFSIAPDPSFLYLSTAHREALAHLMYGFSHGGFVLITGEVGTGKTTLLRNVLKQTPPDLDVAFVLNPRLTVRELLETLCDELGVQYNRSATQTVKQFIDALNRHLLKTHQSGRSTVVIIDEAQNLSPAVLEQVRLLTNLETDDRKLLRIILVGQPELADLLARQELRQLAQRITARYHLGGLSREDTYAYVAHRLSRAGGHPNIFSNGALRRLYAISGGIPRLINVVADRAMLGAYVENKRRVTARNVSRAAREVLGTSPSLVPWIAAAVVSLSAAGLTWAYLMPQGPNGPVAEPAPASIDPGPAAPSDDTGDTGAASAPEPPKPVASVPPSQEAAPAADATAQQADVTRPPAPAPSISGPQPRPPAEDPPARLARPEGPTSLGQRQAYAAVFARWGAEYPMSVQDIPCDFAPSAGLQCLSQYGTWSDIERLDLPVVLELWDEQPAPYHAALTGMDAGMLTLTIGGQELRISQRALRDAWYGGYVVLWQTPPGYRGSLRRGDANETVGWLRQQLGGVTDTPLASSSPNLFDQQLHEAVVEFQRNEGLIIDGVVGPATWIRLAGRLDLPAPHLGS
jgi:general secretion pathway protein A